MSSRNIDLLDAVAAALDAASAASAFVATFTCTVQLLPFHALENVRSLAVFVAPDAEAQSPYTRAAWAHDPSVNIWVVKPLATTTDPTVRSRSAEVVAAMELAEQIGDYFAPGSSLTSAGMKLAAVTRPTLYDPTELLLKRRFVSVINLGFKTV